jgi:hypothetical protein
LLHLATGARRTLAEMVRPPNLHPYGFGLPKPCGLGCMMWPLAEDGFTMLSSSWGIRWWCTHALEVRQPHHGYDGSLLPTRPFVHAPMVCLKALGCPLRCLQSRSILYTLACFLLCSKSQNATKRFARCSFLPCASMFVAWASRAIGDSTLVVVPGFYTLCAAWSHLSCNCRL